MCGISGFVSNGRNSLDNIKSMTDIISHRGPDDEGFVFFSDYDSSAFCVGGDDTLDEVYSSNLISSPVKHFSSVEGMNAVVALGHRRLSILDLSSYGHQPMSLSEGDLWITYNGEVYNYIELRAELVERGYQFISDTDTEVILAAYKEWGPDCLHRFNGMWALAIYDKRKGEIFLARDRFGIKPLYYWFDSKNNFYFGSEIKQFTVCNTWQAKINSQRAYDYLIYSLTDHTDETMFEGVYHIPPGHYYKASIKSLFLDPEGKINPVRWYDLSWNPSSLTFDEAGAEFEEYFKDAVQLHLRSDVPVGSALSGGLDSSAIVCEINNILKSEEMSENQKTFSSCSDIEKYSEKKWMDIVVKHTNVDAYFTYPETKNLFDLTSNILWHQDEPYQSQSAYLGYNVFQLANEKGIKVLLNGQGADEYLGGYEQFNNAIYYRLFSRLRWNALLNEIRNSNNGSLSSTLRAIAYLLIPKKIRHQIAKNYSTVSDIKGVIDIKRLGAQNVHPHSTLSNNLSSVPEITKFNLLHSPLGKYLRWEDRNSMAHSIEARVPFLDHRLVEFTFNLPAEYLFTKGITKRVMRKGLKDILPSKIANRRDKKGFITPEEYWVKKQCPELFRLKLEESISHTGGIIKKNALQYFDDIVYGHRPFDYTYLRLILFAEWVKVFNVDIGLSTTIERQDHDLVESY